MRLFGKAAALGLTAALLLTGCGSSITGVTLEMPQTMERGGTGEVIPTYTYSDGQTPDETKADKLLEKLDMQYSSSDPDVVVVDAQGNLAAVSAGTATVTLASGDGSISAQGEITVVVSPTGITLPESVTLTLGGEPQALEAVLEPEDVSDPTITYTSSDSAVVTVDEAGTLTAVAEGSALVTAAAGQVEASCAVTVIPQEAAEPESSTSGGEGSSASSASDSSGQATGSDSSADAPASSTAYGAVPFDLAAGSGTWWGIDSSDSAFSAVLEGINSYRAAAGVGALTVDSGLTAIADQRCSQLVDTGLTHDGSQTIEIIGQNAPSAQSIVEAWANSTDHYNAMVYPSFTKCGIACWFNEYGWTYWCVTFE